ncbi:MAG: hypothetical protein COW00_14405 [Bdellovibrio sp. CG12_big_fil_rev_8_21_14_0_65_39_13]|nr:MAG: hypothetical protein COW78_07850 [Bdellovibrio sp. CG22_combo_CG10-13_8_21_14_all_39_27]PIQ58805.1 MAG: hypothetical protein COW00_14405 [Bdellovibrio sp. CG12_big_fil_rev_8_21_14_0_65_39_13]PIR35514.1 MAG: hypothetical protein COV37_08545 [Bdellovibrio sp. CG11_big_fil_rev_8_21_14_0_20_39_38]PJB54353.1 MAG: hypothetical protein CO099_02060 [Bdellovibrio sp. CG_4_9_14_3_um_filter_39_7]
MRLMKKTILAFIILPLIVLSSCGKDNKKNDSDNAVSGTNTLSTQQFNYHFCGTIISQNYSGNFMYGNYLPLKLYPENYSQDIQNALNSAGKGRYACVYSRSEPQYEYGFMTFYVEAIQFQ